MRYFFSLRNGDDMLRGLRACLLMSFEDTFVTDRVTTPQEIVILKLQMFYSLVELSRVEKLVRNQTQPNSHFGKC